MKSKLAFGLAISASLALAGLARADNFPASPVLLPAPGAAFGAPTQTSVATPPAVLDPATGPTPIAAIVTPDAPVLEAVTPNASAHVLRPKAVTLGREAHLTRYHHAAISSAAVAIAPFHAASRTVPPILMLGVAY